MSPIIPACMCLADSERFGLVELPLPKDEDTNAEIRGRSCSTVSRGSYSGGGYSAICTVEQQWKIAVETDRNPEFIQAGWSLLPSVYAYRLTNQKPEHKFLLQLLG